MIKSAKNYPVSSLFSIDEKIVYRIPRYQREYTWGKKNWDKLFDDLLENNENYFLGSFICIVDNNDTLAVRYLEVVDGQQRLTTLSLLMAAIYYSYRNLGVDLPFDIQVELENLKNKLVLKSQCDKTRLIPQVQNSNQHDYFLVLQEAGILTNVDNLINSGKRRIYKAFKHFCTRINDYVVENKEKVNPIQLLSELIEKLNTSTMIKIEVESHSNAYTLFESLNNSGVPLTAVDLIKNKLLANLELDNRHTIDKYSIDWGDVIKKLGDDYAIQERYFRQYYNAFKPKLADIVSVPLATKSNLIHVYEKLITHNAKKFLEKMIRHSGFYSQIICLSDVPEQPRLSNLLQDLHRVQGVPSYLLLMLIFAKKDEFKFDFNSIEVIVKLLIAFFVRRNTTDKPATRDLTPIFMDISNKILTENLTVVPSLDLIRKTLLKVSADDQMFIDCLSGSLYEENKNICRFVLCAIEQSQMTRENERDLWAMGNKQFIWTIEHIFPQGDNIPEVWINMLAGGDRILAEQYLETHVHKLGNLTLSGYNGSLSNKSFTDKRDLKDSNQNYVGYKNGLYLNKELAMLEDWSVEKIDTRTQALVNKILEMYPLSNK